MEDIDQQEETGRYTHLVPDYNFDGDRDVVIMKMTRSELATQINRNYQAMKRITEYTAKLYSCDLGLQAEDWCGKKSVYSEFTSTLRKGQWKDTFSGELCILLSMGVKQMEKCNSA